VELKHKKIEIQILPSLLAKYWDIEHDLIYKPQGIIPTHHQKENLKRVDGKVVEAILDASAEIDDILETP
jgi:ppGpp synthetase/RelA/SpoT-type nucleotidyltranferase